jgi:hypothetical protein
MRSRYIVITALAITCAGAASWGAANQISSRIRAATHLAAMAQSAAEEKAKAADLALGISEAAERLAREELAQERKTRQSAEQALDKAVSRTAQAVRMLAGQGQSRDAFEGKPASAEITKKELVSILAAQGTTRKAMESKLEDLDTILLSLDEMVAKQVAPPPAQVRDLGAQSQEVKEEAKPQPAAGKRKAEIKGQRAASNGRQTEKRPVTGRVQKHSKKPMTAGYAAQGNYSPN